ncbi:hypothetical protein J1614_003277 [Plenodomus biglobosus]|nr:hypothetical protein J1614_003277 [Plenodomus biglobosus]
MAQLVNRLIDIAAHILVAHLVIATAAKPAVHLVAVEAQVQEVVVAILVGQVDLQAVANVAERFAVEGELVAVWAAFFGEGLYTFDG